MSGIIETVRHGLPSKGIWLPRVDYDNPGRPADELDSFDDNDNSGMDGDWNDEDRDETKYIPPRNPHWPSQDFPTRLLPFDWIHKWFAKLRSSIGKGASRSGLKRRCGSLLSF
jgi:hypothetical protein